LGNTFEDYGFPTAGKDSTSFNARLQGASKLVDRRLRDLRQTDILAAGRVHERAGLAMMGGEKPGSDGTDPKAAGSDQQTTTQPQGANRPQQRDMTNQMDEFRKQEPATADPWWTRQLNQLYSEVVSEPLPKDIQELVDKLREKTSK
jgi:hypothetical protein